MAELFSVCQQRSQSVNVPSDMCAQRRFKSACAFAQTDQNLQWAHFGWPRMQSLFTWTTKTLIRLRECAGWFESSLGADVRRYFFSLHFNLLVDSLSWPRRLWLECVLLSAFHKGHLLWCPSYVVTHGCDTDITSKRKTPNYLYISQ